MDEPCAPRRMMERILSPLAIREEGDILSVLLKSLAASRHSCIMGVSEMTLRGYFVKLAERRTLKGLEPTPSSLPSWQPRLAYMVLLGQQCCPP